MVMGMGGLPLPKLPSQTSGIGHWGSVRRMNISRKSHCLNTWSQIFLIKPPHCYWLLPADSASGIRVSPFLLYLLISKSCWLFFTLYSLRGPLPSSQIITQRLILSYECPALAWLVSSWLFLTKIILSIFCLWAFIFLYSIYLSSYSMACCVTEWRATGVLSPSFPPSLFSSYLFSLPDNPTCPFSCLAIGHSALY